MTVSGLSALGVRRLAAPFRVRFDESGPSGTIRSSVLLRYAGQLAWIHSERLGFDRAWYRQHGLAWLVRAVDLEILRPIADGDELLGSTEVVGIRRVLARRRSEFLTATGELAAVVNVDWAMTTSAGVLTRVPSEVAGAFGTVLDSFEPIRARIEAPPEAARLAIVVRPQELDPMAHVNNAVYVDWLEEAIAAVGTPGRADNDDAEAGGDADPADRESGRPRPDRTGVLGAIPRGYRLEYLAAAAPGQRLLAGAWPDSVGGWNCRIEDASRDEVLLRAQVRLASSP